MQKKKKRLLTGLVCDSPAYRRAKFLLNPSPSSQLLPLLLYVFCRYASASCRNKPLFSRRLEQWSSTGCQKLSWGPGASPAGADRQRCPQRVGSPVALFSAALFYFRCRVCRVFFLCLYAVLLFFRALLTLLCCLVFSLRSDDLNLVTWDRKWWASCFFSFLFFLGGCYFRAPFPASPPLHPHTRPSLFPFVWLFIHRQLIVLGVICLAFFLCVLSGSSCKVLMQRRL